MVLSAQRTIFGLDLALANLISDNYIIKENTSLNEKFGILPNERLPDGVFPKLKYYAIGIGGQDFIQEERGYNYSLHNPSDAALFEQIPFVMRTVENDLLPAEQNKYRFRTIETHDGVEYVCYYLRQIETIENRDYFYKITSDGIENNLSVFTTNTDKLLNPVPVDRTITYDQTTTIDYITKLAKLEFSLNTEDLEELTNVLTVRNQLDKRLTEIGICTGHEYSEDNIREAIGVQIAFHVGVDIDLMLTLSNGKTILRSIELGGAEPLVIV